METLNPHKLTEALAYIDHWLELNFKNARLPGLQVAIWHNGKIVHSQAFGHANVKSKQKLTTEHAFRIASQSKMFTATAVMQLAEAGKLHLDDKVSRHLDWFKSAKDPRVADITIRQLLNHTTGLIRDGLDAGYWLLSRDFPNADDLKAYAAEAELVFASDEIFKYSNVGYGYLGLLIEAVSGLPYNEYVSRNIVKPLGLQSTGVDLDVRAKKLLATGYGLELFKQPRQEFRHLTLNCFAAAAGFYSTAEDMCRYLAAHCWGNNSLLNDASKKQMQHGYWQANEHDRYGLGMIQYQKDGWKLYGHTGSFVGYKSHSRFDPQKGLVVSVIANATEAPVEEIGAHIVNIIDTFQQDTGHLPGKTEDLRKFAGTFYYLWGVVDIVLVGKKLFGVDPLNWQEFDCSETLSYMDKRTLKIEQTSGYFSPGELLLFDFDKRGIARSVNYAGITMVPWEAALKKGWF